MRLSTLLLCVVTVVIVAATLGIVYYLKVVKVRGNEREVSLALRSLVDAEASFCSNDIDHNDVADYWTGDVAGLYYHHPLIEKSIALADVRPLKPLAPAPTPRMGYYFVAMESDDSSGKAVPYKVDTDEKNGKVHNCWRFGFCAYPAEYGVTGRFTFLINEAGMMFKLDTGGEPVLKKPVDVHGDSYFGATD
jgi:hypothetical protein